MPVFSPETQNRQLFLYFLKILFDIMAQIVDNKGEMDTNKTTTKKTIFPAGGLLASPLLVFISTPAGSLFMR